MHWISLLVSSFIVVSHVLAGGPIAFKDGRDIDHDAAHNETELQARDTSYFMGFQGKPLMPFGSPPPPIGTLVRMTSPKGAKGARRYLNWSNNDHPRVQDTENILAPALLRSWSAWSSPPTGFQRMTTDINAGRGGDYLYVVWKI
ncbi:MAG: hypothetical protein Q9213_002569 [Squamulea squamosa]